MIKIIKEEELARASDIFFNNLKSKLSSYDCPEFIAWMKENDKTKIKDPHHIFGSYGPHKSSDLFIKMVTRTDHAKADAYRSEFAIEHLAEVLNNLQKFTMEIIDELRKIQNAKELAVKVAEMEV